MWNQERADGGNRISCIDASCQIICSIYLSLYFRSWTCRFIVLELLVNFVCERKRDNPNFEANSSGCEEFHLLARKQLTSRATSLSLAFATVSRSAYSSLLKLEATCSCSETSVDFRRTAWHYSLCSFPHPPVTFALLCSRQTCARMHTYTHQLSVGVRIFRAP
jgi:hypothetical protein